jgi:hypothetical protein
MDPNDYNELSKTINDNINIIQNSLIETGIRLQMAHLDLIMALDPNVFNSNNNNNNNIIDCQKCLNNQEAKN